MMENGGLSLIVSTTHWLLCKCQFCGILGRPGGCIIAQNVAFIELIAADDATSAGRTAIKRCSDKC